MTTSLDKKYMRRCLQLASNAVCSAAPNPMVGAVIVCDGCIIGEGYHIRCGGPHAEVNAINSVKDKQLLQRSTIYVSLEPCSHYGKTPPCAELIIKMGIPRVVVGCMDPFPLVAGRGIKMLREAGVDVQVGVLEDECRSFLKKFITYNIEHRPYITLKWAESSDNFIDIERDGGSPFLLSSEISGMAAHKRRAESSAILVGRRTALLDNPSLTTRHWGGPSPVRMVIDREGTLPSELKLFDGSHKTVVFTCIKDYPHKNIDVEYISRDADFIDTMLSRIYEMNLQSLLVEGGSSLLSSFIDKNLWDEIWVEKCPAVLGCGVKAPGIPSGFVCDIESHLGRTFIHIDRMASHFADQ